MKKKSSLHQPHDKFFKANLSIHEIAYDFFSQLPDYLLKEINLEDLVLCPSTFIDKNFSYLESDVLYRTSLKKKINEEKYFVYLLVEHQTTAHSLIPIRMMSYAMRIIENHQKQFPKNDLVPFVYFTLYYQSLDGKPYPSSYPLNFFSSFPEELSFTEKSPFGQIQLIDLAVIKNSRLMGSHLYHLMYFVQKNISLNKDFTLLLNQFSMLLDKLIPYVKNIRDYVFMTLYYIFEKAARIDDIYSIYLKIRMSVEIKTYFCFNDAI